MLLYVGVPVACADGGWGWGFTLTSNQKDWAVLWVYKIGLK